MSMGLVSEPEFNPNGLVLGFWYSASSPIFRSKRLGPLAFTPCPRLRKCATIFNTP
ncbi:MAG: hypothetical protein PHU14_07320 [Methylovulum sp.]|nr:hypothetical protein [Methylovulum sp.]